MNAPTLFDTPGRGRADRVTESQRAERVVQLRSDPEVMREIREFTVPRARTSDGVTAKAAAKRMESGNGPLMQAIRREMKARRFIRSGPQSAFDIAKDVQLFHRDADGKPRWKEGTIRSAVSRAPFLRHVDNEGEAPGTKLACRRYVLEDA